MAWSNIVMNTGNKVYIYIKFNIYLMIFFLATSVFAFSLANFIVNITDMVNLPSMTLTLINNSNLNL